MIAIPITPGATTSRPRPTAPPLLAATTPPAATRVSRKVPGFGEQATPLVLAIQEVGSHLPPNHVQLLRAAIPARQR